MSVEFFGINFYGGFITGYFKNILDISYNKSTVTWNRWQSLTKIIDDLPEDVVILWESLNLVIWKDIKLLKI
jgi:hypothetical protein